MNGGSVVVFDIGNANKEHIANAREVIRKNILKAMKDDAIKEAEQLDKLMLLKMGENYLSLREAADELCEAAKRLKRGRNSRIAKAVRAYEAHRRLEFRVPNPLNPGTERL